MENSKLYAVTGNPVLHSKSPDIYNALFAKHGIAARYIRMRSASANEAVEIYRSLGLAGMNVTAPFKEGMLELVATLDHDAAASRGVNTITGDDALAGFSTDAYGVRAALAAAGAVSGQHAVLLGAGGAARAAIVALQGLGCTVTVLNRTVAKAEEIAAECGCSFAGLDRMESELARAEILVSTLPHGADTGAERFIREGMIILDANYAASVLYRTAKEKGAVFVNGLEWLVNQAIPAYAIYTQEDTTAEEIKSLLAPEEIAARKENICLVGFMGCGKSSVGEALAALSGRRFIDTDRLVEEREGRSISEIFTADGEERFRELESAALADALAGNGVVVSCGGGAILRESNRALMKRRAVTVWVYSRLQTCVARLDETRPLLAVEDRETKAKELFAARRMRYAEASDILVYNENRSALQCAEMIHDEICHLG